MFDIENKNFLSFGLFSNSPPRARSLSKRLFANTESKGDALVEPVTFSILTLGFKLCAQNVVLNDTLTLVFPFKWPLRGCFLCCSTIRL